MKKARKKAAKKKAAKKKTAKKTAASKKASAKKAKSAKPKKKAAKKATAIKKAKKKAVKKVAKKSAKKVVTKAAKKKAARKAAPRKKAKRAVAPQLPRGARAAPLPVPAITPESPEAILLALAKLLLDEREYHEEVQLAATNPEEYATTFGDRLKALKIDAAPPALPWIALTDGLRQRDALVQLDQKFEPDDLSFALESLLGNRDEEIDLAGLPGYDDGAAALQAVGDRLDAAGLALVTLDGRDSANAFPLAVLPSAQVAEAQRLAASLGLGSVRRWSSDELSG